MGNGMESRLNFSDELKQSLSQNAMTEEMAKKFLMSNGISEEKVNAHLNSIKYTIEAQKTRKREETLNALLTLYSYISEKGYVVYDASFLAKTDKKIPEKVVTPKASSKVESKQKITIVERVNQTYDGTLPSERQKSVREYFANRGNETIVVQGKERKISEFLQGNALKDGKIGAATIALEEKMKSEQSVKKSPKTPIQQKSVDTNSKAEVQSKDENANPKVQNDEPQIAIIETNETY